MEARDVAGSEAWSVVVALAAAACGAQSAPLPDASVRFTFEVNVAIPSPIDQVTVDGTQVPIVSGAVDVTASFANYADGMMAPPMEFDFYSQSQLMSTGHAVAGACQILCREAQCADLSKFVDEQILLTAGDFTVHTFNCIDCKGPSWNFGACQ